MKLYSNIISTAAVLFLTSSFAIAEVAASKGDSASASKVEAKKTGCPVRPKVDPKLVKECPKSLGETPLEMETANEFEVEQYHPDTESYSLIGVDMPDEGDFSVTLDALAKSDAVLSGAANSSEKMAVLKKSLTSPCDLLKKKFKIKSIQTLSNNDLKARKNCVRK